MAQGGAVTTTDQPAPPPTDRSRVRRRAERGHYDRDVIDAILDAGSICHLGFAVDGRPWVIPTVYRRIGDQVYIHGATGTHALRALLDGAEACLTVTHLDGLVLARSAFHHSANYRSVMVFGTARRVDDADEARRALLAIVGGVVPGRADDCRPPTDAELRSTLVLAIPLDEASAKVRTGPPIDEPEDLALPFWAGVVPTALTHGEPVADEQLPDGIPLPDHLDALRR
jgi:nitroimidazol reductase NimA-like FMN-containing flavoprotein (pyridoxamine 5'-phosphate oxidase superfamily)